MITHTIALYELRQDVTLTAYVLSDSLELLNGGRRPAVLICPGGAYLSCSDREAEPVALRFAAMGYHAVVLRYSTYSNESRGSLPLGSPEGGGLEVNPLSVHPAPTRDIGAAFLAIRAHAEEWLVDMDKIALCGFSAGAHNCAMYSVYWRDPSKELLDAVSPALRVTASCPPTFLWATAADALVPAENSTIMATALAKAGVPFELHVFEAGPHGLSLADQAFAGSLFEIDDDAALWIGLAERWLMKHFALQLPEKPAWLTAMEEEYAP